MHPARAEVWLFDLGMAAKTRPVLVVSTPYRDDDRALRRLRILRPEHVTLVMSGVARWLGLTPRSDP
jgi:hypothetical protein